MLNTKRIRFPVGIIWVCIRWYAAYSLSYRHLEKIMEERGVLAGIELMRRIRKGQMAK